MSAASRPPNEADRMASLRSYDVLDSACEDSFDTLAWLASRVSLYPTALISLVDTERQWFKARCGLDLQQTSRDASFCAHAILAPSEPLIVPDTSADPRFADNPLVTGPPFIRAYVGIPLVNPEGYALGTLCVIDSKPRPPNPDLVATLAGLAKSAVTTLELRRAMHQIRDFAMTDPLTGLSNRPAFNQAIDKAMAFQRRHCQPFAVMYIDLDRFKAVNDTQGHQAGDNALRAVADVLRATFRQEDTVARLGGDEFAVVLTSCDEADGEIVGDRFRASVNEKMQAGQWNVTASVGGVSVATVSAGQGCDVLAAADAAMYAAKAAGGDRTNWRNFNCNDNEVARNRAMLAEP